ncbi:MAG: NifB/NifX family molybdenum-iron cluster-binding protein, partial [Bacteroidales bacterium]
EKYLIASTGDTLDSKVSGRFGHSNFFLVVDPQTMNFEAFSGIPANEPAQNINQFIQGGIKKVIVGNIGPSTFFEITSSGFKIYLCRNMWVKEAIKKVENGEIEPLNEPTLSDSIYSGRKSGRSGQGSGRRMGGGKGSGR